MLARSEGTQHVACGRITEIEREALVKLRNRLREGLIPVNFHAYADAPLGLTLHMATWCDEYECGTVGCVAGLCYAMTNGVAFAKIVQGRHEIDDEELMILFVPPLQAFRDAKETADAIDTFLNEGRAHWKEILWKEKEIL